MSAAREGVPVLEARDISKAYPGTLALDGVCFDLHAGEVHGLVGENGAGKSTLMRILAGIAAPTSGTLCMNGTAVELKNVRHARSLGIVMVHQELENIPVLSVAENLLLGRLPRARIPGFLDKKRLISEAEDLLRRYGIALNPRRRLSSLSTAEQQFVEVIKAVSIRNARVILMDEPTSSLSATETAQLFEIVGHLRAVGVGVVYVSHRLDEVTHVADRISVLRDGRNLGTLPRTEFDRRAVVSLMLGHEVTATFKPPLTERETVFEIRNLSISGRIRDFSAELARGEILGIAGLVGSGKDELAKGIFGLWPWASGEVLLEERRLRIRSPRDAIRRGIVYLPEERKQQAIFSPMSVLENITATWLSFGSRKRWRRRRTEHAVAADMAQRLNVKAPSLKAAAGSLSGGNQQKVILSRLLAVAPKVMILNEPTRGVDVGSKEEIYAIVRRLSAQGTSIVVLSSDIPELEYLAHRVFVLSKGEIRGRFEGAEVTTQAILACATRASA